VILKLQTLQIRIPEDLLSKVDEIIKNGLFRSRSHLLREALSKYISELNNIGTLPYIVGPFTPEEIKLLKSNPQKSLDVPNSELKLINKELTDIQI